MGLRSRIRERVQAGLAAVTKQVLGTQPYEAPGMGMGARTGAWPPSRMGTGAPVPEPVHPVDAAAAGEPEPPGKKAPATPDSTPSPSSESTPAPEPKPTGSVPQADWLPMPDPASKPTPEPAEPLVEEPVEEPDDDADEPAPPAKSFSAPPTDDEKAAIEGEVVSVLKTIFDPEIPVDIYELGLIYDVDLGADRTVEITMTLTSPNCPAAQSLPAEVETKSASVEGVEQAMVDIVWEPPWGPERMSEAARLELNIDL